MIPCNWQINEVRIALRRQCSNAFCFHKTGSTGQTCDCCNGSGYEMCYVSICELFEMLIENGNVHEFVGKIIEEIKYHSKTEDFVCYLISKIQESPHIDQLLDKMLDMVGNHTVTENENRKQN